ncbi:FadR/GntR family transcriptional regulator [Sciscionella marina]|uniref:FadR/GntR family transcriptional regulator n=1 Tax=Sciscionella marina TaxID=508770 RepID=UPI00146ADE16|nr:FCD domain-containing protein [Sciscionella marina]
MAKWILRANPHPGAHAPTARELATELGTSRQSVTRALDTLSAIGLVSSEPSPDGTRLLQRTGSESISTLLRLVLLSRLPINDEDLLGVRIAVERASASAASATAAAHDLRDFHRLVVRMRQPSLTPTRFSELDTAFHLRLAQTAGGLQESLLGGLAIPIQDRMTNAFQQSDDWEATAQRLAGEHAHLLALIGARQATEAAAFLAQHVHQFYTGTTSTLPGEGEPTDDQAPEPASHCRRHTGGGDRFHRDVPGHRRANGGTPRYRADHEQGAADDQ